MFDSIVFLIWHDGELYLFIFDNSMYTQYTSSHYGFRLKSLGIVNIASAFVNF